MSSKHHNDETSKKSCGASLGCYGAHSLFDNATALKHAMQWRSVSVLTCCGAESRPLRCSALRCLVSGRSGTQHEGTQTQARGKPPAPPPMYTISFEASEFQRSQLVGYTVEHNGLDRKPRAEPEKNPPLQPLASRSQSVLRRPPSHLIKDKQNASAGHVSIVSKHTP
ncbi:hypothetical protein IEQ34_004468 [Dendrobium chrysotoxum]|uniref:Uncharacterized protein n=1 Tax=Dendrobium chrysotoxum TaxID=161865 RepID=A0AAV7HGF0_DENCH|nr:hypothetical protein IEQ34_004468 [Dendrobium chrysotoxum]